MNTRRYPRSMAEAFKDAPYACAVTIHLSVPARVWRWVCHLF